MPKAPQVKETTAEVENAPVVRDNESTDNATPHLGPSHDLDIKERIEKIKNQQKMERMAEIQRQQQRKRESM